jgi:hypothetical protein
LAFFNPNFTFDLCITPSLDNLGKVILQYVTPTYILLLMAAILLLTCFKRVSRMLGHHSILQGLWLLFLISYFNIANASYELLYCVKVGPIGSQEYVLVHDASIKCYTGLHLPFAIIAWLLIILFVLPLPIYLLVFMKYPKLKPISDVYCSHYKDGYRWWIALSLARRLLLVIIGVFITDFVNRHFVLLLALAVILVLTMLMSPYKVDRDNYFVTFVTWMLLIIAINTEPYLFLAPLQGITFTLVAGVIIFGISLVVFEVALLKIKKQTLGGFYDEKVRPRLKKSQTKLKGLSYSVTGRGHSDQHELEESTVSTFIPKHNVVDATAYREPLLDSQFYSSGEADKFGLSSPAWSSTSVRASGKQDSAFPHKRFGDEEGPGTPLTTEIRTDRSSDSGLATAHTDYASS